MIKLKQRGDWLNNAGILGLLRVIGIRTEADLEKCPYWDGENLYVTKQMLSYVKDNYFEYLVAKEYRISYLAKIIKLTELANSSDDPSPILLDSKGKKGLAKISKDFFSRRGVQSALARMDEEYGSNLLGQVESLKKVQYKKEPEAFLSSLSQLLEKVQNDPNQYISKIDAINSYLAKFLGSQFTFVKGTVYTKYFEEEFDKLLTPIYEYLDDDSTGKYKEYKYTCAFCGNPMKYYGDPSGKTHGIVSRGSSVFEGLYFKNKASVGYKLQPDEVGCPICTLLLALAPLGLVHVGKDALFVNNSHDGIRSYLGINYSLEYEVQHTDKATYGDSIRKLIELKDTHSGKGDNVIHISISDDIIINHVNLSPKISKKLGIAKPYLKCYYINQEGNYSNAYEELINHIDGLNEFYHYVLNAYIVSPDKFHFNVIDYLKDIDSIKGGNKVEDKNIFGSGYSLANSYVKVTGNNNKLNKIIFRLLRMSNNKQGAIEMLTRMYAYSGKAFNYKVWQLMDNQETFKATLNSFLLGIMAAKESLGSKEENVG